MSTRIVWVVILSLCVVSVLLVGCPPPGPVTWAAHFGDSTAEKAWSVALAEDGGYLLVGRSASFAGDEDGDLYFQRVGADGSASWGFTHGGATENDEMRAVVEHEGGYVMAGYSGSYGGPGGGVVFRRLDDEAGTDWNHYFGGHAKDDAWAVVPTSAGGYAVAGVTRSYDAEGEDMYLVRTLEDGALGWEVLYGGPGDQGAFALAHTIDKGFILAGYTWTDTLPDMTWVKTSRGGTHEWTRTYAIDGSAMARDVIQTSDGGFALVGFEQPDGLERRMLLVKTGTYGHVSWTRAFSAGTYAEGWALDQTTDGGYVLAGTTVTDEGGSDMYLVKTDADGVQQWSRTFGGAAIEWGYDVRQTPDGGYVIAGYTDSFGEGRDAYLVKTDANGNAPSVPGS